MQDARYWLRGWAPNTGPYTPDADVAGQLAIRRFLNTDVDKGILPEDAFGIQIGRQKPTVARQGAGRR